MQMKQKVLWVLKCHSNVSDVCVAVGLYSSNSSIRRKYKALTAYFAGIR